MERCDVRLAGLGGQGLILAGLILGEAVAIYDKKNAVQTINYAPLARGAPSRSEVVVSEGDIYFPEVEDADILMVLSQEAYKTFINQVKPGATIIADASNIKEIDREGILQYPISDMAIKSTGRDITASIVGLGIIARVTGVVSADALRKAVRSRVPRGTVELNLRALESGLAVKSGE